MFCKSCIAKNELICIMKKYNFEPYLYVDLENIKCSTLLENKQICKTYQDNLEYQKKNIKNKYCDNCLFKNDTIGFLKKHDMEDIFICVLDEEIICNKEDNGYQNVILVYQMMIVIVMGTLDLDNIDHLDIMIIERLCGAGLAFCTRPSTDLV